MTGKTLFIQHLYTLINLPNYIFSGVCQSNRSFYIGRYSIDKITGNVIPTLAYRVDTSWVYSVTNASLTRPRCKQGRLYAHHRLPASRSAGNEDVMRHAISSHLYDYQLYIYLCPHDRTLEGSVSYTSLYYSLQIAFILLPMHVY